MKAFREKETQIWHGVKTQYKEAAAANTRKIATFKTTLEDLQAHTHLSTEHIHTLLQTNDRRIPH